MIDFAAVRRVYERYEIADIGKVSTDYMPVNHLSN